LTRSSRYIRIILPLTVLLFLAGGSLFYWRSSSVLLTADGRTRRIFTKASDIRHFIDEQHLAMGPNDFTTPPPDSLIVHNTAVKITRVTTDLIEEISKDPPIITWQNRNRQNLRDAMAQRGYAIAIKRKIQITKHDNIEISRAILAETKAKEPFYNVILFGKDGQIIKKYNLLVCKMLKMRSTGYYLGEKTVPSDVTFTGHKFQHGLVAVDPKVIPLRTRLYVEGYGYAYAADTGSAIKGLRIDLAVKDRHEEAKYNRYNVPVYILEKSKKW